MRKLIAGLALAASVALPGTAFALTIPAPVTSTTWPVDSGPGAWHHNADGSYTEYTWREWCTDWGNVCSRHVLHALHVGTLV